MNTESKSRSINWRKYIWVGLVLLVAGYTYGRPTLEKWTGMSVKPADSGETRVDPKSSSEFRLTEIRKNRFESPAGLVYTMGPGGEHRIDHVLRHGKDAPERPVHSVFSGDRDTILSVIDEGFELVQSQPQRVKSAREGNRTEYTIDMQKKIGFEGGQKGKRQGFPPLNRLKLVVQNQTDVVTAYPCR